jgi:hypothetical protein
MFQDILGSAPKNIIHENRRVVNFFLTRGLNFKVG